jgi:deltex-like protein
MQGLGRPAAAAAAAAPVGRWEWLDDKGRWRSYDAHLSAMLEAEFTASKPGADLPGRHGWHVDFTTMPMQQQNTATTGAMRNVQRVTDAGTAAAAGAAVAATFDALKGSLGKILGGAGGGGGGAPGGGAGAAADGGGGGGGGGAMMFAGGAPGVDPAAAPAAAAAEAPAGAGAAAAADDLPYGGDIQAAMRANDRDAIRQIMAARSAAADGGGAAAADGDGDGGAGGGGDAMDMDGGGGGGGGAGGVEAPSPAAAPAIGAAGGMAPPIPWAEIASSIPAGEFDGCFEPTDVPFSAEELREDCAVCYCPVYDPAAGVAAAEDVPTKLNKCGHCFHRGCINDSLAKCAPKCPVCSTIYGTITGNQPEGAMDIKRNRSKLPGYESARGTIVIDYCIPGGTQGPEHPNPGVAYHGANRTCYIPDSDAGNALLAKLQTAWDRKLIFTVGTSTTSGRENMTIWCATYQPFPPPLPALQLLSPPMPVFAFAPVLSREKAVALAVCEYSASPSPLSSHGPGLRDAHGQGWHSP